MHAPERPSGYTSDTHIYTRTHKHAHARIYTQTPARVRSAHTQVHTPMHALTHTVSRARTHTCARVLYTRKRHTHGYLIYSALQRSRPCYCKHTHTHTRARARTHTHLLYIYNRHIHGFLTNHTPYPSWIPAVLLCSNINSCDVHEYVRQSSLSSHQNYDPGRTFPTRYATLHRIRVLRQPCMSR